jgi:glycosyltransferase involved in cell wall biosynthesis
MKSGKIAIMHYSSAPIIGGVESVIDAHVKLFLQAGYDTTVIAGRGSQDALPSGVNFVSIPEIDSQYPSIKDFNSYLEMGEIPSGFDQMVEVIFKVLAPVVAGFDHIILHNVFTKHFNLPLTAALFRLLDQRIIRHAIAWCHDFTWTSPSSRVKVHPGYPWDLLRTQRSDMTYVVVSKRRQGELAGLFTCPPDQIKVVYNGVDPVELLGLTPEGRDLILRLGLLESEINLLMPVRVTRAKNIEYALHVLAEIKSKRKSPKLVLTGPPDPHDPKSMIYYDSLIDLREQLNLREEFRFVFESGVDPQQPYVINNRTVGDLFRVSDMLFMPSHREGFGMPVLEAGLAGLPIVSTDIPASAEIAKGDALIFPPDQSPEITADQIIDLLDNNSISRLRRRVRLEYTWQGIFHREISPLLEG